MSVNLDTITQAWTKAWHDGDTAAFESVISPDYVRHSKTGTESIEDVRRQIKEQHAAFSDFTMNVLDVVEGENDAAIRWRSTGVHTGEYMGVPPTGRTVSVVGASFVKFEDGLVVSEAVIWDPREMLSAVGIWHLGHDTRKANA
ncbi:MAG: ester cyclase [Galactobacter sp.]|uniref:ester cyclase n=1 Tax=Galactobacter sp. TaxID=2676125 RepID=UPI0025BC8454|nr:ester cyclase [Galactobacter sp.]